jgi:oligogalacturonide lyase
VVSRRALWSTAAAAALAGDGREWIDPKTGRRLRRLADEPGSASLYFHQQSFTPDGERLIYTAPSGLHAVRWRTLETKPVVRGQARAVNAGRKQPLVYFTQDGAVWCAHVDTGAVREIGKLPARGGISTSNADDTLLAGTFVEGEAEVPVSRGEAGQSHPLLQAADKGEMMERRLAARLPMAMFTMETKTGRIRVVHRATDWLNHLQFSPTDPGLLMFCHEGPWHKVDRLWNMRVDEEGAAPRKLHTRTMAMEIFGHEFFSWDGATAWYDLQTPRGEVFWLAGLHLASGRRRWYSLQRDEWSIHFNANPDGTLFAGDGGDERQVARARNGRWIYLFRPELLPNRGIAGPELVEPGVLRAERLVEMGAHDYRLEPNVMFTPDGSHIVFRSNLTGATHPYLVEAR